MTDSPALPHDDEKAGDAPQGRAAEGDSDPPRGLPRTTFLLILAVVVALFLVARGAVWRNPWDPEALDSAIFWSYLPIPFLVAGGLLIARRFSWRFLFLESMAITLLKYVTTFLVALAFWATSDPRPRRPRRPLPRRRRPPPPRRRLRLRPRSRASAPARCGAP